MNPNTLAPPRPLLYSFRRCPYAIRARMALQVAGLFDTGKVDICEVALRAKPAALLAISPKATVPVLHLPSGEVIDQSLDIMAWALRQADPEGWSSTNDSAVAKTQHCQRWITLNDGAFKAQLDRYKYPQRHPELPMVEHRSRALTTLIRPMDDQLRLTPFLLGERASLADVALFPFVRQFAMVDLTWFESLPLTGVQTWLQHWLNSDTFSAVMQKPAKNQRFTP